MTLGEELEGLLDRYCTDGESCRESAYVLNVALQTVLGYLARILSENDSQEFPKALGIVRDEIFQTQPSDKLIYEKLQSRLLQ